MDICSEIRYTIFPECWPEVIWFYKNATREAFGDSSYFELGHIQLWFLNISAWYNVFLVFKWYTFGLNWDIPYFHKDRLTPFDLLNSHKGDIYRLLEFWFGTYSAMIWEYFRFSRWLNDIHLVWIKISHIFIKIAWRHLDLLKSHKGKIRRLLKFWFGIYSTIFPRHVSIVQCLSQRLNWYLFRIEVCHISKTIAILIYKNATKDTFGDSPYFDLGHIHLWFGNISAVYQVFPVV